MADTPDTPETPAKAPTPPRRRAASRKGTVKPTVAKSPPTKTADEPKSAAAAPAKRSPAPKPRSTKRAAPAPARRPAPKVAAKPAAAKTPVAKPAAKAGGKWNTAAVAGGVAAIGVAATAALLSLRGSSAKSPKSKLGAHTPDGTDASKSFEAGIADENSIPDKL